VPHLYHSDERVWCYQFIHKLHQAFQPLRVEPHALSQHAVRAKQHQPRSIKAQLGCKQLQDRQSSNSSSSSSGSGNVACLKSEDPA
jgi:hypothetical protein